jgi:uncharacterized alpha-E superfamily protein
MLGRTAASLFWMSRYVERAENIARLTEVGYRISLTPDTGSGHREDWKSTLVAAGCLDAFLERHPKITAANVQHARAGDGSGRAGGCAVGAHGLRRGVAAEPRARELHFLF